MRIKIYESSPSSYFRWSRSVKNVTHDHDNECYFVMLASPITLADEENFRTTLCDPITKLITVSGGTKPASGAIYFVGYRRNA